MDSEKQGAIVEQILSGRN